MKTSISIIDRALAQIEFAHRKTIPELDMCIKFAQRIHIPLTVSKKLNTTATRVKEHISQKLDIDEFDYITGKIKSKRQTYKIGKLLKDNKALAKKFQIDPIRNAPDLRIVISRRPRDIITMSTGRGWSSCMEITENSYSLDLRKQMFDYVDEGALIAYLIRKDDIEIKNPLSRVLIKPYVAQDGERIWRVSKRYGIPNRYFMQSVNVWVRKNLPYKLNRKIYTIAVYRDKTDLANISPKNITFRIAKNTIAEEINFFRNNKLHRDNGPAVLYRLEDTGELCREWYKDGILHREGAPAVEIGKNYNEWMINGKYHRLDGPAIILFDGDDTFCEWWINGKEYTEKEFKEEIKKYEKA